MDGRQRQDMRREHACRMHNGTCAENESKRALSWPYAGALWQRSACLAGGCRIGARPVDLHIKGLNILGADIKIEHGILKASASRLKGGEICLDFPSVGATENLMMAASLAEGETMIVNAAQEPEVCDLARLLIKMGADIRGAGEDTLYIKGRNSLHGAQHRPIPDRIEAGTFMICAAACGGEVRLKKPCPAHLKAVSSKLMECRSVNNRMGGRADCKTEREAGSGRCAFFALSRLSY